MGREDYYKRRDELIRERLTAMEDKELIGFLSAQLRQEIEHDFHKGASDSPLEPFMQYQKFLPRFQWVDDDPDPLLTVTVDGEDKSITFSLFWTLHAPTAQQAATLRGMLAVLCA